MIGAYQDDTSAPEAGIAYLFSTNGAVITTFTNPQPDAIKLFGREVVALGSDRVIVGSLWAWGPITRYSAVYVFNTNGSLLSTLPEPQISSPGQFGFSVAAVGSDFIAVGAQYSDIAAMDDGVAYLFNTNGSLVTVFTNPTPEESDWFGIVVIGVGTDKVLIGAPQDSTSGFHAGAAYLFQINGNLIRTFPNPDPDHITTFGRYAVPVGDDKFLLGCSTPLLYCTDGTLITAFPSHNSGLTVAALGSDKVVIEGNPVCIFSTNGMLITSITNPSPSTSDMFGDRIAVSQNQVLISAAFANNAAPSSGCAYLFDLITTPDKPFLHAESLGQGMIRLDWPSTALAFELEESVGFATLPNLTEWKKVNTPVHTNVSNFTVTLSPTNNRFFRLRKN